MAVCVCVRVYDHDPVLPVFCSGANDGVFFTLAICVRALIGIRIQF